ncbi:MAG: hypothetical protein IPO98_12800 [Saprospiraceae bacterium]|nr:hypothetical protein [Saprospiraceae bacterium]
MIGILIALSINNWNEANKIERKKQKLVTSLIEDFEFNRDILKNSTIIKQDSIIAQMDTFFSLTKSNTPLVSVDSLRKLAGGFFRSFSFIPNLTSYNEAVASGNLSLLQNKALLEEFTLFNRAYDDFRKFEEAGFYSFYSGSSWELRKTAKPGLLYGREPAGEISYVEYKKLISSNLAQNCFENSHNLARNTRRRLFEMLEKSETIIQMLKKMQTQ